MDNLDYKKYPILYVDDEELALLGFKNYFGKDFSIFTAVSGEEGIDLVRCHPEIVLILTDQKMPRMTGVQLLQRVMEIRPNVIRMLITAFTEMKTLIDAVNIGQIYQYIEKPYEPSQLSQYIKNGIEKYYLIEERDRLYAEKIETLEKMSRANRLQAIGILAAGMAHEINNPLVAIRTFLEMVPYKRTEDDRDFWEKFYYVAHQDVIRIQKLIAQLLAYSRNYEESKPCFIETDLNSLIKESIFLLQKEAAKKNLFIEEKLSSECPPVFLDPEKIKQVMINLILNGIQATNEGSISIKTEKYDEETVQISITDTGSGISEENLQKIFNPFFTTKEEGTGLGLITCHHITEQHRGTINIKSQLSKGTTFLVSLPINPLKVERRLKGR